MKMQLVLLCVCVIDGVTAAFGSGNRCGVEASSNRIHHNPWLVLLEYYWRGVQIHLRCGGTLVDGRHVVTAAHCVRNIKSTKLVVRLGDYDLTSDVDCVGDICADPELRVDVAAIIIHPEYNRKEHDIAILKLVHDVLYTDFIRPICLPTGEIQKDVTFSATGWGELPGSGTFSKVKKILPLPYWTMEDCKRVFKDTLPKNIICAGGEEGVDTCRGDSGGPLVWYRDTAELWGVTSCGNVHCGTKGNPGIYTSVAAHLEWIMSVINN